MPSQKAAISEAISDRKATLGGWITRFGLDVVQVGIESVQFSPESRELVKQFSSNAMSTKAYDGISQATSNIAAQQKIAKGFEDNGFGDGGGLVFGMNLAQSMSPQSAAPASTGVLSQEEFEAKKRQVLEL